jgi:hypothetical protein
MKCPRCHVDVPIEASRCPGCKLSKPKSIIAKQQSEKKKKSTGGGLFSSGPVGKGKKLPREIPKWLNIAAGVLSAVLLLGVGGYIYWYFANRASDLDPKAVQPAMLKLRQSPSQKAGMTVDQYLAQELETSRRVGNLRSIQGWTMRPVIGSSSKILISFAFQESDQTERRAEWIADLSHDTFTPQTDLAAAVYHQ